jgi:hypothetical protein
MMLLILAHFFTAHGSTIGGRATGRSPLGLPAGSVRILLVAGYLGLAYYLYHHRPQFQLPTDSGSLFILPFVLLTAFFLGHVATGVMKFVNRGTLPAWFQDVQAWVALVALFLFAIVVVIRVLINPELSLPLQIQIDELELGLAGVVGLYFGGRW